MPDYRFRPGMRFRRQGRECLVREMLPDSNLAVEDRLTRQVSVVSSLDLVAALFAGEVELLGDADQSPQLAKRVGRTGVGELADLAEEDPLRLEALRRLDYVARARREPERRRSRPVLEGVIREVATTRDDRRPPSWSTLYRWLRDYEAAGQDVRALVPARSSRGNRRSRITGRRRERVGESEYAKARIVDALADEAVRTYYLSRARVSVSSVHQHLRDRILEENRLRDPHDQLPVLHLSTLYRRVARLDPFEVAAARYGRRVAAETFHAVRQGPRTSRPLQRVELDHTRLDLMVVDTDTRLPLGRPWLTSMLDAYSRMVVGMHLSFRVPGYLAVMQCLRHAAKPKTYLAERYPQIENDWPAWGLPELLVVDNGKEFHSRHFDDACLQLGVQIDHAPPRCGAYKGAVERWFGTQNTRLLHELPGTTFSDIFERGDYDPARHAVISMEALVELVHVWIVDVYNRTPHRGVKDIPYHRWREATEVCPPRLPFRAEELDVLIGCVAERAVTRSGIELFTLRYNSPELGLIRRALPEGAKARLKYDPGDVSQIFVLDPTGGVYVPVPALDQEYTCGLTLWQHDVIRAYARRQLEGKVDAEALSRARARIEQIVAGERVAQRSLKSRQKAARYLDLGQPGARPTEPTAADARAQRLASPSGGPERAPKAPAVASPHRDLSAVVRERSAPSLNAVAAPFCRWTSAPNPAILSLGDSMWPPQTPSASLTLGCPPSVDAG